MKTLHQHNRFTQFFFAFLALSLTTTPALAANSGPASGGTSVTIEGIHFTQVSVGESFAMGLTNKGTVYTWGDNTYGELGNGTTIASLSPEAVLTSANTPLTNITAVAAGANFGLALTSSGTVYSWGLNDVGQLGVGSNVDSLFAVQIQSMNDIDQIEANGSSAYALTKTNGEVYAWGFNGYGQLGNNTIDNSLVPGFVQDTDFAANLSSIVSISAGANTAYAIDSTGLLWSWGRNNKKQLGDATTALARVLPVKMQFSGLDFGNVIDVVGGDQFALAQTSDGSVYAWGYNVSGSTGLGTSTGNADVTKISSLSGIIDLSTAGTTSFALRTDGSFYSWGSGINKTLGDGGATRNIPTLVTPTVPLASLTDGTSSMLGLDTNGNVYGWGSNSYGLVGDGTDIQKSTPVLGVNFLANQVTFNGTAGTNLVDSGINWTVNSPAGIESTTVDLLGQANLRTGTTDTQTVSFTAGTFEYEAAPVVQPDPDPVDEIVPDPVADPVPDPIIDPIVDSDPTPTQIATATASQLVAPEHDKHPTVKGSATIKQVVVATHGTWTGNPQPTTTIQWYRCAKSVKAGLTALPTKAKCTAIKNATKTKYTLAKKDKAKFVVALISGTNSSGVQSVTSPSTKKVKK